MTVCRVAPSQQIIIDNRVGANGIIGMASGIHDL